MVKPSPAPPRLFFSQLEPATSSHGSNIIMLASGPQAFKADLEEKEQELTPFQPAINSSGPASSSSSSIVASTLASFSTAHSQSPNSVFLRLHRHAEEGQVPVRCRRTCDDFCREGMISVWRKWMLGCLSTTTVLWFGSRIARCACLSAS